MQWIVDNWGSLASLLGLILSFVVLFVSVGAKKAAEGARKTIEQKTLVGDLRAVSESLEWTMILSDNRRWDLANHVASRTLKDVTYIQTRWNHHLAESSQEELSILIGQLDELTAKLAKCRQEEPSESQSQRIARVLQASLLSVTSQVAQYERETEN